MTQSNMTEQENKIALFFCVADHYWHDRFNGWCRKKCEFSVYKHTHLINACAIAAFFYNRQS